MKKGNFKGMKELEKHVKACVKGRLSFSRSLLMAFLMCGVFGYANDDATKSNIVLQGAEAEEEKIGFDTIYRDGQAKNFIDKVGKKSVILAPGSKSLIMKKNKNFNNAGGNTTINDDSWMTIKESVVIGHRARTNGNKTVAVGEQAFAALNSAAFGSEAIAYGQETVALGMQSYAEQTDDVALGHRAYAKGSLATALGSHSIVESQGSTAIGHKAEVGSMFKDSVALGSYSKVTEGSTVTKDTESELDKKTWISEKLAKKINGDGNNKLLGAVSIGSSESGSERYRQLVNLAPGTKDTHAVNLGQLREALKTASGVQYFAVNLTNMQNKNNDGAKASNSIVIGNGQTSNEGEGASNSIHIVVSDADKQVKSAKSLAIGYNVEILGESSESVLLGSNASIKKSKPKSIGIGANVNVDAGESVVIGADASVENGSNGSVAIGKDATVEGKAENSIALGNGSKAKEKKKAPSSTEYALGESLLKFSSENSGVSSSDDDTKSVLSIGDEGSERVITNVAAGTIKTGSTDAVNGGQLYGVIDVFGKLGLNILGVEAETTEKKFGFKAPNFAALKITEGNETDQADQTDQSNKNVGKKPKTFKDAIDANITKLNEGLKIKTAKPDKVKTLYLGETLTIVGKDTETTEPQSSNPQTHQNILTELNGNKLTLAFNKDLKGIESITLSKAQTYNSSSDRGNDVITKKYLEEALDQFKIKVKVGDNEQEIGRGDTLELAKGENINIKLKPEKASAPATQPADTAVASEQPTSPAPSAESPAAGSSAATSATDKTPKTVMATVEVVKELKGLKSAEFTSGVDGDKSSATLNKDKLKFVKKDGADSLVISGEESKITGLADITKESKGDTAANKNYVDALDNKIAVMYVNETGERLVRKSDGTFVKESDMKTTVEASKVSVVLRDDKLSSALGLSKTDALNKDANKAKGAVEKLNAATDGLNKLASTKDLQALSIAGINFVGNDDKTVVNRKLGESLTIKGADGNITVKANDKKDTLEIKLSKDLTGLESATFTKGAATTKITAGKITGLDDPTDPTDAANKRYVDSKLGDTKQLANDALGGVAGAIAMANLLQANSSSGYRHQLSAAFGTYSGKQAIAVGYSGTTDSGRLVYKLSGSVDSGGKIGIGAGIGIMLGEKIQNNLVYTPNKEITALKEENKVIKQKFENIQKENKGIKEENERIRKENAEIKKMLEKLLKDKN